MRTQSTASRTPRRSPARPARSARTRGARSSDTSELLSNWIDTVSSLLNDPDPATRERGLAELQRGFDQEPGPWIQDKREMLAATAAAAAKGALGTQPETHIVLAQIQLRQFGDGAGAELSLWHATFGASRLASSNLPAHRERAAQVNRAASRLWGELGNAYQRDARNVIGRYYTARLTSPIAASPVLRAWPDVGRSENSSRRQPSMGPPQRKIPVPILLKTANAARADSVPPRMSGIAVRRMSAADAIHSLGALVGVIRRADLLAAYLTECESARVDRDMLPVPRMPGVIREIESSLKRALQNPALGDEQRAAARRLWESLDLGFMIDASIAYWGTGR